MRAAELPSGLFVGDGGLLSFDAGESVAVSGVEVCRLAKASKSDGFRVNTMEFGKSVCCGKPAVYVNTKRNTSEIPQTRLTLSGDEKEKGR